MEWKSVMSATAVMLAVSGVLAAPARRAQPAPRRIEITAKRFSFDPSEVTGRKGEPLILVIRSMDVTHGLRFRELNLNTTIDKGKAAELSITPDRTGDFVGHCSVFCGVGHGEMTMTLHVVE